MKLLVEIAVVGSSDPATRRVEAGQDTWKFPLQQQENELYYRVKCSGAFVLQGADFAWLRSQYDLNLCCTEVLVNVYTPACDLDGDDTLLWPGYFRLDAVKWDFYACKATIPELTPRDGYDALYRVWETPVNVITPAQPLDNLPFMAQYDNYYTWQPNAVGELEHVLPDGNIRGVGVGAISHLYSRGMHLMSVISRVWYESVRGTAAQSNLFAFFAVSDFFSSSVNPVTGRLNRKKIIMAGSDAKRPASVTPAVKMVITLKELLDDLKALYNVYHVYDPKTGDFRLEHYSWFAEQSYQPLNRISLNLARWPDELEKANNESVTLENLFGIEEIYIQNNQPSELAEFKTGSVRYSDKCVVRDDRGVILANRITCNRIFTDLDVAYRHADAVGDDALFLCEVDDPNPGLWGHSYHLLAKLPARQGSTYSDSIGEGNNGDLTAAKLFTDYHRHGRSFVSGIVNAIRQADGSYADGVPMAMLSTRPTRRQEGISIKICCEDLPLNLNGYFKTNRFERCHLDKAEFDPATDTIKLDVVASSRCQASVVVPGDPGNDCAPKGTFLRTEPRETTGNSSCNVDIFADGACGEYELSSLINGC